MQKFLLQTILPPLVVLVVVTTAWEIGVRLRPETSDYQIPLPSPTGIVQAIVEQHVDFRDATLVTAEGALLGFAISGILGGIAALLLSTSVWIKRAFYPYTLFFQTVPVIAIAPMLVIWSGAGLRAVVIVAVVVSIFPVIAGTLDGLLATDPALEDLFQLYGAGWIARLWKLRLPSALPSYLTGLRVAAGLSVIGTVVAEFFVGTYGADEGLGVKIVSNAKYGHIDAVFAGVLLASALGLILFGGVNLAGQLLLRRWHASAQHKK